MSQHALNCAEARALEMRARSLFMAVSLTASTRECHEAQVAIHDDLTRAEHLVRAHIMSAYGSQPGPTGQSQLLRILELRAWYVLRSPDEVCFIR